MLLHCMLGRSRSAALAAALIHKLDNCSIADALARVQERRPQAAIRQSFVDQLEIFDRLGDEFAKDERYRALLDRRSAEEAREASSEAKMKAKAQKLLAAAFATSE